MCSRRLRGFHVFCSYDRAGYGGSDAGPMPRTSARIAQELHALLQHAGEAPPYLLVGSSFGGYSVRVLNGEHPDQVVGLCWRMPRRKTSRIVTYRLGTDLQSYAESLQETGDVGSSLYRPRRRPLDFAIGRRRWERVLLDPAIEVSASRSQRTGDDQDQRTTRRVLRVISQRSP